MLCSVMVRELIYNNTKLLGEKQAKNEVYERMGGCTRYYKIEARGECFYELLFIRCS
jgi:hypothetical protein